MTTKARNHKVVRRRRAPERRTKPRIPEDAAATAELEPEFKLAASLGAEVIKEAEDGWGPVSDERPFEEEDVPPRNGRLPRSEPAPEPEEPDVES